MKTGSHYGREWDHDFCAAELHVMKEGAWQKFQSPCTCLAFILFMIIPPVQSELTYNVPTATYLLYGS